MKIQWWRGAVRAVLFAGAAMSGCGGGSPPPASSSLCGVIEPCGGDVTGTWKVIDSCANITAIRTAVTAICPQETVSIADLTTTGSITFNADMTYTSANVIARSAQSFSEPIGCLNGMTCADRAASLNTPASTGSCSGSDVCVCSASSTTDYFGVAGTYSLYSGQEGFMKLASNGGGNLDSISYCVQGEELHLITLLSSAAADGGTSVLGFDVVARRQ